MLICLSQPAVAATNLNPGVLPVQSKAFGMSYGEWNARWWQWALSMPITAHPLYDTADCSAGQFGPVWFLGGTFSSTPDPGDPNAVIGTANRACSVPAGKALFIAILNTEASTLEGNGTTEEELRANANFIMDHAQDLFMEIDGVAVQEPVHYRADSPLFIFGPLPANNVLAALGANAPAGATSQAVAAGISVLLRPLSAGSHVVHFGGQFVFTEAQDGFDFRFSLDVTYHLIVGPQGRP
jgi:hypothetical protein